MLNLNPLCCGDFRKNYLLLRLISALGRSKLGSKSKIMISIPEEEK